MPRAAKQKRRVGSTARKKAGEPTGDVDPIRQRILRGAAKAFGERGFGGTSVEAILDAAQVSRRTFYRVFRSKEDVLRALFDNSVQMLLRAVREASQANLSRGDLAQAAVEAYVGVQAKAGPLARVLLLEQFSPDSPLIEQRNRALAMFTDLLTSASAEKDRPAPDPVLVSAVVAAINHVCVRMASAHREGTWDVERAKRAILRILFALDERSDPSTWS
jgi:AcrR family transcriptional regulator